MTISERYIAAKRRLFELADSDLNERQREAVYNVNGPLLVIAGAGSGKTTVLVRRIAQIVRYGNAYASDYVPEGVDEATVGAYESACGLTPDEIRPVLADFVRESCPPWNVLAITFTNKAASEMKERLTALFGDSELSGSIWAGTFHAICMRIIRAHPEEAGCRPGVAIYDTDDSKKLMAQILRDLDVDDKQFSVKTCMSVISRAKERLLSPEAYAAAGGGFREKNYSRIYEEYSLRLEKSNALDFDDIIMRTVFMLRSNDSIRRQYARRFRYVCVDEYQDTNRAQFELCRLFASEHGNIMVVGDDDQSIYRFRGATVENILGFDRVWKNAAVVKLEQNYRSTGTILSAANAVIERNPSRRGKTLWTENGDGKKIILEKCPDEDAEARRITDIIQKAVAEKRYSFRDFAVLYRVNAQSNVIERTFAKSAVPYRIYGGQRFNDRKEIKDVVAYLQLICNPSDRVRLKRIINEPKRKIGEQTVAAVETLADETGRTMSYIMEHAGDYVALQRSAGKLMEFASVMNRLREIKEDGCPLDSLVGSVLDMTGYRQMLLDAGEQEKDRLDNVNEFVSGAVEYMNRAENEATLEGFLEENALVADIDAYDESADAVVLMTVHSAKGLEFPVTILPGMEEGIFPSAQALMEPAEIEEERRLAYVAITRAKQELYILYSARRLLYGRTAYNEVSRFINDIPASLIDSKAPERRFFERDPYPEESVFSGYTPGIPRVYVSRGEAVYRGNAASASSFSISRGRTPAEVFEEGDRVVHPTFGGGEIISVKKIGPDTLYEVAFDTVGTKKIMGTYAKFRRE